MPYRRFLQVTLLVLVAVISWTLGNVHAYSTEVVSNLQRTRDALLNQRSHLESKADEIKRKIDEYNRNLAIVNGYLRETDNALKDVENAIRRAR